MRLDHLLSKEHLQHGFHGRMCLGVGVVRGKGPQHGRMFRGGCSWVEYQRIAAAWFSSWFSTVGVPLGVLSWNGGGGGSRGLVFGTLLGPEATGLSGAGFGLFPGGLFVSGFLAALIAWLPVFGGCVWGVWYGVVV